MKMKWRAVAGLSVIELLVGAFGIPSAAANTDLVALNGRYLATSNGDWAKTNSRYRDEATVRSIWSITSTCSDPWDCIGTITSELGWSAPIRKGAASWVVEREIPDWEPCPDGTTSPGHQLYRFWRVDPIGQVDISNQSLVYGGRDTTAGISGACGINQELVIELPFRLEKLS